MIGGQAAQSAQKIVHRQIRKIAAGEDRFGEPGGKGVLKSAEHAFPKIAVGLVMQGDVRKPVLVKPGPEGIMVDPGRAVEPDRDFCGRVPGQDIAQKRCVEAKGVGCPYSGGQAGFDLAESGEAGEDDEGVGGVVHCFVKRWFDVRNIRSNHSGPFHKTDVTQFQKLGRIGPQITRMHTD